jgi:lysosomal Pro-X carboxypeptidase
LVIFAEHRYYGESLPFGNNSFNNENLQFLTTEQALADYALLIKYIKKNLKAESCPVITFGGSYGGMLSAWFRLKYPTIVTGAIASSAPILQFYNTGVSEWIYSKITTDDFSEAGCSSNIKNSFLLIKKLSETNQGLDQISNDFKLCSPLKNIDESNNFISWLESGLQYMAMIDYPYPTNFLEPVPAWPVKVCCQKMLETLKKTNNLLKSFSDGIGIYYNYSGQQQCYNLSSTTTPALGTNQWDYQSCTEMVFPISSNGTSDMFLPNFFNLKKFIENCQKKFGVIPRENWIITNFGGDLLPDDKTNIVGSNIIFSNGRLDPWRGGSIQKTLDFSKDLISIFIEDGAHHLDLRRPHPSDPQSVIDARTKEMEYIQKWVYQYFENY